jgi:uncharacterized protein (DUF1697 family)
MPRYIAFLRAINVGGRTVKMDRLRQLLEALGLAEVETFIASGNVIFKSPSKSTAALEKKIESHLQKSLGYAVETFVRTSAELAAIARYQAFPAAELQAAGHNLYVGFVATPPSRDVQQKVIALRTEAEEFHIHEREVYWLIRTQFNESTVTGARLERTLRMPTTVRNITTVKKLADKYPEAI